MLDSAIPMLAFLALVLLVGLAPALARKMGLMLLVSLVVALLGAGNNRR